MSQLSLRSPPQRFLKLLTLFFLVFAVTVSALKCRSEDGLSDEELKGIVRSCMIKADKISSAGGYYGHQDSSYNHDFHESSNINNGDRTLDRYHERNREQFQLNRSNRSRRSSLGERCSDQSSNGNHNSNQNQRSMSASQNSSSSIGSEGEIKRENEGVVCVAHCFFDKMNTLNNNDYPDKQKVNFMLTKDIRDRELRTFYSDTVQGCFHYLESQHRKDRCQFSRELIHCMMEYVRANCEDWQEHNLVFN